LKVLATILILFAVTCNAQFKIAVIDSGFKNPTFKKLCADGHYDYIAQKPGIGEDHNGAPPKWIVDQFPTPAPNPTPDPDEQDVDYAFLHIEYWHQGHGTNIVRAVDSQIKDGDYCFIILKVFERDDWLKGLPAPKPSELRIRWAKAILHATDAGAKLIVIAGGGKDFHTVTEKMAIEDAINHGVKIFTVAGNENQDLNKKCNYYIACYKVPGVEVIGALDGREMAYYTNTGKVITGWQEERFGDFHGTSQACALAAGRWANKQIHGDEE